MEPAAIATDGTRVCLLCREALDGEERVVKLYTQQDNQELRVPVHRRCAKVLENITLAKPGHTAAAPVFPATMPTTGG